mmetsp:Transcript_72132/g.143075  ORF Transcript_72132/g.143075 Transcript_72132/m.143075 type:complete len:133 (-) Transcript_72132:58-456(-)
MMRVSLVFLAATLAVQLVAAEGWSWWWSFGSDTGSQKRPEPQELEVSKSNENIIVAASDPSVYDAPHGKVINITLGSELQTSVNQESKKGKFLRLKSFGHITSDNEDADLPATASKPTERRLFSTKVKVHQA